MLSVFIPIKLTFAQIMDSRFCKTQLVLGMQEIDDTIINGVLNKVAYAEILVLLFKKL